MRCAEVELRGTATRENLRRVSSENEEIDCMVSRISAVLSKLGQRLNLQ